MKYTQLMLPFLMNAFFILLHSSSSVLGHCHNLIVLYTGTGVPQITKNKGGEILKKKEDT